MPVRIVTAAVFLPAWESGTWTQRPAETQASHAALSAVVTGIIARVRSEGQAALLDLTRRLDQADLQALEATQEELAGWAGGCPADVRLSLECAAGRIRDFSTRAAATLKPRLENLHLDSLTGVHEAWCALARVGLYVPGGRAIYPSSVLMTAIPAREAGVGEVVLCTPPRPDGSLAPPVAAAAIIAGVDRVFRVGGAQAIAAMAIGSGEVARVDKVAGPGNAYVTEAKRQLYGETGLDGLAGPSEVVAISARPRGERALARQLLAQAEHDPDALALGVILPGGPAPAAVLSALEAGLKGLPAENRRVSADALAARGALIAAPSTEEAIGVARAVAPEHLWIDVPDRLCAADIVRAAAPRSGAVFLGTDSPVAMGDYVAGPSHVLPTAGSARWASPLGPADFMRRVSLIALERSEAKRISGVAAAVAAAEGFAAHAMSLPAAGEGDGGINDAKVE